MKTFSVHNNSNIQTSLIDIMGIDQIDLDNVLNQLQDNTNKEIFPEVIRNSVLTSNSTSAFKETSISGNKYIGIDNLDNIEINKDIIDNNYLPILIGKRTYSGTYSYNINDDIINHLPLGSTYSDLYFFNTKRDSVSNNRTRINILSNNKYNSPYIQSQIVKLDNDDTLSFDIINDYNIDINSKYVTASVNNIVFPTTNYNNNNVSDSAVLSYDNGILKWDILSSNNISTISNASIYGNSFINGYPLEFTDNRPCGYEIGDIKYGETFENEPIVSMLRRMIYTYTAPECELHFLPPYSNGYAEIGSNPLVKLSYKITKNTLSTITSTFTNMIPSSYPPISGSGKVVKTGVLTGVIVLPFNNIANFSITVSDSTQSNTYGIGLNAIYPYYYGFISNSQAVNSTILSSLNKLIEPIGNKEIEIIGGGDLCFIYDDDYNLLTDIKDENNNSIINNFIISTITLSSNIWSSKNFKVYRCENYPFTINIEKIRFEY